MSDTPRTDHLTQHARTMAEVLDECERLERELGKALRVAVAARKWNQEPNAAQVMALGKAVEEWEAGR